MLLIFVLWAQLNEDCCCLPPWFDCFIITQLGPIVTMLLPARPLPPLHPINLYLFPLDADGVQESGGNAGTRAE